MSRPVFWADVRLVTSSATHEVGTVGVIMPVKGMFNNLVIFDQHVSQNSLQSIIPELGLDLPPTQQL